MHINGPPLSHWDVAGQPPPKLEISRLHLRVAEITFLIKKLKERRCNVKIFRRSYRAFPAGPAPLNPTPCEPFPPAGPDFDLILTRFGPEIRLFRSESGQSQVKIRSGGGVRRGLGPER